MSGDEKEYLKRTVDRWNEAALDLQEETERESQQFIAAINSNSEGVSADREKFIHKGKTGSHKVFQERG